MPCLICSELIALEAGVVSATEDGTAATGVVTLFVTFFIIEFVVLQAHCPWVIRIMQKPRIQIKPSTQATYKSSRLQLAGHLN